MLITTLPQDSVPYLSHKQLQVLAYFKFLFLETNIT